MNKDDLVFSIIGIGAGLVIGFLLGNWTWKPPSNAPQQTASSAPAQQSVNSGGSNTQLPANHPPVDPSKPVQAGPLSPGQMAASPNPPAGETAELPSLEPLPASSKEERAEQKYKNIQLLKGIPAERLTSIMFAFKASLGVECTYCHVPDQFEKDDKPMKQMARKMISMMSDINAKVGGSARVTCNTCHRGQTRPAQ